MTELRTWTSAATPATAPSADEPPLGDDVPSTSDDEITWPMRILSHLIIILMFTAALFSAAVYISLDHLPEHDAQALWNIMLSMVIGIFLALLVVDVAGFGALRLVRRLR